MRGRTNLLFHSIPVKNNIARKLHQYCIHGKYFQCNKKLIKYWFALDIFTVCVNSVEIFDY